MNTTMINTSTSSSSSQINSSEDHTVQWEDIDFLEVVDINDLICFISKKIMLDPVQLSCGHTFSRDAINKKFLATLQKICPIPTCSQFYTSLLEENYFLKEVVTSCLEIIQTQKRKQHNEQLRLSFNELSIPGQGPQEQKIRNTITLFLKGSKESAINMMVDLMMETSNGAQYAPIVKWMEEHSPFSNNKESLSQQADRSTPEDNSPEHYKRLLKGVKFFDVIKIHRLVFPHAMAECDLDQLIPCGDIVSHRFIRRQLFRNQEKICPDCEKPYTSAMENLFVRKVIESLSKMISRPDQQLKTQLVQLYNHLPESQEKQKINKALDFFFQGLLKNANDIVADIILSHSNDSIYWPLFRLMSSHANMYDDRVTHFLEKQGHLSAESNSAMEKELTQNKPPLLGGHGVGKEKPGTFNQPTPFLENPSLVPYQSKPLKRTMPYTPGQPFGSPNSPNLPLPVGGRRGGPIPPMRRPTPPSSTSTDTNSAEQMTVLTRSDEVQEVSVAMNNEASSNASERKSLKRSSSDTLDRSRAKRLHFKSGGITFRKSIVSLEEKSLNDPSSEKEIADEVLSAKKGGVESEGHHSSRTRTAQEGENVVMTEVFPSSSNASLVDPLKRSSTGYAEAGNEPAAETNPDLSMALDAPEGRLIYTPEKQT